MPEARDQSFLCRRTWADHTKSAFFDRADDTVAMCGEQAGMRLAEEIQGTECPSVAGLRYALVSLTNVRSWAGTSSAPVTSGTGARGRMDEGAD